MVAELFLASLVGLVAALLAFVTFASFARAGHRRLVWVGLAFAAFGVRAAWTAAALAVPDRFDPPPLATTLGFDLAMLLLLYLALLLRARS